MKLTKKNLVIYNAVNKLLSSKKTFKDIFEEFFDSYNKHTYLIYNDKFITYDEAKENIFKFANTFSSLIKDKKGSFVALKLSNGPYWIYCFWALLINGYKPLLINNSFNKADTELLINESHVKTIICEENNYEISTINVNNINISKNSNANLDNFADEVAFCTSGTSGNSKIFIFNGACSVENLAFLWDFALNNEYLLSSKDINSAIAILPFAHIYGFIVLYMLTSLVGKVLVFPKSNNPDDILSSIKKYKVTHIYCVPLLWNKICDFVLQYMEKLDNRKKNLMEKFIKYNNQEISKKEAGFASSKLVSKIIKNKILGDKISFAICGGSYVPIKTLKTINGLGYRLVNGYGMTEVGICSFEMSDSPKDRNSSSIGTSSKQYIYKINEDSELLVKSRGLHIARLVDGKIEKPLIDDAGYFHTGDLAIKDEKNRYFIKGKIKDLIIGENGENIDPLEIENKFKTIKEFDDFVVVGKESTNGEELSAVFYINPKSADLKMRKIKKEALQINNSLPLSMRIKHFYLSLNEIPKNASFKVIRYKVKDNLINSPQNFVKINIQNEISFTGFDKEKVDSIRKQLRIIFAEKLLIKENDIHYNDHIIVDLGGDSLSFISILTEIDRQFNVEIQVEDAVNLGNIDDFTYYLLTH